jgi:hypothetical protein
MNGIIFSITSSIVSLVLYKNKMNCYILIFYPETLLNYLFYHYFSGFSGLPVYVILLYTKKSFISFQSFHLVSFNIIFLPSCPRTSSSSIKGEHLSLVPGVSGKVYYLSSLSVNLAVGFYVYHQLQNFPSVANCWMFFIVEVCQILPDAFFLTYCNDHFEVFFPPLVYWYGILY